MCQISWKVLKEKYDITKEKKTMKPHPECSSFESMEEIESYHSFINKLNVLPLISDVDKSVNSTKTSQVKSTEIFANMHKNTNGTGTTNVYKGSLSCNDSLERKLVQKKRTKKEKRNGPLNTSFINNFNNLEIYCTSNKLKHKLSVYCTSNKLKHKLSVSSHSIAENGTCNTPLDEDEVTKNDSTSLQGRAENLLKQGTILDPSRELSDQSQYRLSSTLNSEQGNTRSEDYPKSETEERLYCYSSSNEGLLENTNELNKKQISFGESFKSKKK
ncbi:hypothetical protein QE152_g15857 [Popillia japonica]|uniref:Uncharacterized protein n=1 Tax=Popillia japonica TaxID=7064 RepID=A0AAW1L7Q5_POPJA